MAEFEMISAEEMRALKAKEEENKIDQELAKNIAKVPVGAGWRMTRPEEETQRNFKRRVNAAAAVSFRTLDWTPQETNLPAGQEPKTYVIRVKSIDLKAKAAAEAQTANGTANPPSNAQNQPQESQQTPAEVPSTNGPRNRQQAGSAA